MSEIAAPQFIRAKFFAGLLESSTANVFSVSLALTDRKTVTRNARQTLQQVLRNLERREHLILSPR
jgi:hypothetical protein